MRGRGGCDEWGGNGGLMFEVKVKIEQRCS